MATRHVLILIVASLILMTCSGCATMLGGIIGYQSGELAAGLAIGAAVDFGGVVVTGVGKMLTDEKKEFRKNAQIDSDTGQITLPANAFSCNKFEKVLKKLQSGFQKNGWSHSMTNKTVSGDNKCQTWQCTTAEGESFKFITECRKRQDPIIKIELPPNKQEEKSNITMQIYQWLEEAV